MRMIVPETIAKFLGFLVALCLFMSPFVCAVTHPPMTLKPFSMLTVYPNQLLLTYTSLVWVTFGARIRWRIINLHYVLV